MDEKVVVYAYMAGLFDGEGTVTLMKHKGNEFRSPHISIVSCTLKLLEYVKSICGGYISSKRPYRKQDSISYTWTPKGKTGTFEFVSGILPFIKEPEKIRRIQLILDRYEKVTPRNGKYSITLLEKRVEFEKEFFKNSRKSVVIEEACDRVPRLRLVKDFPIIPNG